MRLVRPLLSPSLRRIARCWVVGLLLPAILAGCTAGFVLPPQPANIDDVQKAGGNVAEAKRQAAQYHDSGEYLRTLGVVSAEAQNYVTARAKEVAKPALVLDVDETSLSNWPEMIANKFEYIPKGECEVKPVYPCGFDGWVKRHAAEPIAPTLELFEAARHSGVAVFFVTGRTEDQRDATAINLHGAGYTTWAELIMEPNDSKFAKASDYKAPARAMIERWGYTIIANVGDQPSDLDGGHAERDFLLPDPFYRIP